MASVTQAWSKVGAFGRGAWRYWRLAEPSPESNVFVQKLYAFTDGRSNDILFRILESKRKESDLSFSWDGGALESHAGIQDGSVDRLARTLKDETVVVARTTIDSVLWPRGKRIQQYRPSNPGEQAWKTSWPSP